MKSKLLLLLPILAVALGIVGLFDQTAHARLTGTNPNGSSADAFCVGKKSSETCVDYQGNVIPTTNATETLGTSALGWLQGWITTVTATTVSATTVSGTTGNITTVNSTTQVNSGTSSSSDLLAGTISESGQTAQNNILQAGSASNYFAVTKAGTWAERHGTAPVASSCGTNPSVVTGNAQTGDITLGTVPGATCTITFPTNEKPTNIPHCSCSNRTTTGFSCQAKSTATTLVIVGTGWTGTAATGSANDVIDYQCSGHQ